jgi:hypothetical protein
VTFIIMSERSCPSRDRTRAYRERLAQTGEPPAYVVANAITAAALEAKLASERLVDLDDLLTCAIANVASDHGYTVKGVEAVWQRFGRPVDRRKREDR